jgi:putative intracellular protease/amidase
MSAQAEGQKTIAFVLYPGLTPLDLIGPLQVLSALAVVNPTFRTTVVAERIETMPSDTPVGLTPERVFDDEPNPFAIVVPGGGAPTIRALANPAIVDYVQSAARSAELVTSVCTGSLILAAEGVLEGRQATTHWAYAGILERLGATYVRQRWVEDDATAVGDRHEGFEMSITVGWPPPDPDPDRHKAWVRDAWEALRPYGEGVYANFISDEGTSGVEYAYGDRLQRLQALKASYDPDNFFHLNNNIAPSTGA